NWRRRPRKAARSPRRSAQSRCRSTPASPDCHPHSSEPICGAITTSRMTGMKRPRRASALAIVAAAMIAAGTPALTKEPETPVPAPAFSELRDSFRAQTDHEARAALIPQIEAAAEGGNSWAMLLLGDALARGEGVSADAALALVWYKRAAEAGNVQALLRLGATYRDGLLVPADPARAIAAYEK